MATDRSFNILAINWQDISNPFSGGAEVHFHEIFKRLAAAGHRVTLLCCKYSGSQPVEVIDGIRILRHGSRNLFNLYVPYLYRKLRAEDRFDVVIDDINKIPFYTPLYVREPILAIVHHLFGQSIYLEAPFIPASYVLAAEKIVPSVYRNTPFAVVSESTRKELLQVGLRSQVDLLPNAVDLTKYQVLPLEKSATPLIGYLGRLKKYKSVDHILQAMPEILRFDPRTRLVIIGDGDRRPALESLTTQLGIEASVEFAGQVSQIEKVRLLNQVWLTINPSPKEGWGLTVIEANACGVPTVAADSPGLRDSVMHQKTGLLYRYGDTSALARSVIDLLGNNEKRLYLSAHARQWAEKFNWDDSAQKALELIQNIYYIGHKGDKDDLVP
jgi:glycosyltransferase involved in cell wall biosynthesis